MATYTRTLNIYALHGHIKPGSSDEENLDYEEFFKQVYEQAQGVPIIIGTQTVAIASVQKRADRYAFRFISGSGEAITEVFNPATNKAELIELPQERFVVNGAWVIVSPTKRLLVAERKRPGVPVFEVERFLNRFAKQSGNGDVSIALNPVPSPSFVAEVESFSRIREASVLIRRPNSSFSKTAQEAMGRIAADSNAGQVTVQANAERGQSLRKDDGLVADILSFAKSTLSPIEDARIKGERPGFDGERSISLLKHVLKGTVRLTRGLSPEKQLGAIYEEAEDLIDVATERDGGTSGGGDAGEDTLDE